MNRLNGWQRLWVVLSIIWVLMIGWISAWDWIDYGVRDVAASIAAAVAPPAILYAAGLAGAWVWRGFRSNR